MDEWVRLTIELLGVALIVTALALADVRLGLLAGGIYLIFAANFYMGKQNERSP